MKTKSGKSIFPIGIGTWGIAGTFVFDPQDKYKGANPNCDNEVTEIDSIRYSLNKGQNHIDCAELYGAFHTDEVVGKAISNFKRKDLFVADKLWKTSVEKGKVRLTVNKMLKKLNTDYLDLLYIHAPWQEVDWVEAIPQIDELIDEGVVRYFGVSNFTLEDMKQAQKISKHPISANQMNYNVLYKDEVTDDFVEYCASHNIQIVAYQPIKRKEVYNNDKIKSIAEKYKATPAQVALAWLLEKKVLPIPKAVNKTHIDQNVDSVKIMLTPDDIYTLDKI